MSINNVTLTGRLTADPTIRTTPNGKSVAEFSIAVDRRMKVDGQPAADFPRLIAWGKTAELIGKYFTKGRGIGIVGRLQTGSYKDKDGKTVYTTDVIVENVSFIDSKKDNDSNGGGYANVNNRSGEEPLGFADISNAFAGFDDDNGELSF